MEYPITKHDDDYYDGDIDRCRYSEILKSVLTKLGGEKVLRGYFVGDYQGEVDIDVLLKDGRVFSYHYYYGSCSGCDEWENKEYTDEQIEKTMQKEATYFDNMEQYNLWRNKVESEKK